MGLFGRVGSRGLSFRLTLTLSPPPPPPSPSTGTIAGNTISFVVQAKDSYDNTVSSHQVASSSFTATVVCTSGYCTTLASVPACSQRAMYAGDGKYELSVSCDAAGSYTISTKYSNALVASGQWVEPIVSARASGADSLVVGSGAQGCTAGSECRFTATIFDSLGNPRHTGGDNVRCSLAGPDATATTCRQVTSVGENYTFAYTTPTAGTYTPAVSVEGQPIPLPSSTVVVVPAASRAEDSQFFGQGTVGGVAGVQQSATVVLRTCIERKRGEKNVLHVHLRGQANELIPPPTPASAHNHSHLTPYRRRHLWQHPDRWHWSLCKGLDCGRALTSRQLCGYRERHRKLPRPGPICALLHEHESRIVYNVHRG